MNDDSQIKKTLFDVGYQTEQAHRLLSTLVSNDGLILVDGGLSEEGVLDVFKGALTTLNDLYGHQRRIASIGYSATLGLPVSRHLDLSRHKYELDSAIMRQERVAPDILAICTPLDFDATQLVAQRALQMLVLSQIVATGGVNAIASFLHQSPYARKTILRKGAKAFFIKGAVSQRLVPTLCQTCALDYDSARAAELVDDELVVRLAEDGYSRASIHERMRWNNPLGCDECGGTGRDFRTTLCSEVVVPDRTLLTLLAENDDWTEAWMYWRSQGVDASFEYGTRTIADQVKAEVERGQVDWRVGFEYGVSKENKSPTEAAEWLKEHA